MNFKFKHPKTNEIKTFSLSDTNIQNMLSDELYDLLNCDCEPIGETNVVECGCEDYICDFVLQDRS
jgi:hypothetical protein